MIIINNKDKPLKIYELLILINDYLNNNKFEYLFIINNHSLTYNDEQQYNYNDIKFKNYNLKEFIYISENSENINKLIKYLSFCNYEDNDYNIYEGYDEKNNLIFFRKGITHIQSFDLINLFSYNKKLIKIKLINENIVINYNKERTKLEILNIEEIKNELNNIINTDNYLHINHFTQFIYNQNNLKELTISRFDFIFKDLINNKINTLNINYEYVPLIMKYKLLQNESNEDINKFFPNLIDLNIGGECYEWLYNIKIKDFSDKLKIIRIISKPIKRNKISKIQKKFNKYNKKFIYEFINNINNKEKEEIEEEEAEEEERDYYIDEDFSKYDSPIFFKRPGKIINYKTSSDRPANRKYLPRLYHMDFIHNLKEEKFLKEFREKHNKAFRKSLFENSKILQKYSKKSKIFNKIKEYFYLTDSEFYHPIDDIKLLYSFKKNFEQFKNIVCEEIKEGYIYVPIIEMDCGLYFFKKFFTTEDYSKYQYDIKINSYQDSTSVDIGSILMLEDSFSEGTILEDIEFINSIISKNTKFKIVQLELYKIIIEDIRYISNKYGYSLSYGGVYYSISNK